MLSSDEELCAQERNDVPTVATRTVNEGYPKPNHTQEEAI
jgi:hypothetical protein